MRAKIFAYIIYKNPNFCTPEKFLKIILKFEHDGLSLEQEVQSDVYGVTNSVDTDEAAPQGFGLDCFPRHVCLKIQENYIMY